MPYVHESHDKLIKEIERLEDLNIEEFVVAGSYDDGFGDGYREALSDVREFVECRWR